MHIQVERKSLEGKVYGKFAVSRDRLNAGASSGILIVSA